MGSRYFPKQQQRPVGTAARGTAANSGQLRLVTTEIGTNTAADFRFDDTLFSSSDPQFVVVDSVPIAEEVAHLRETVASLSAQIQSMSGAAPALPKRLSFAEMHAISGASALVETIMRDVIGPSATLDVRDVSDPERPVNFVVEYRVADTLSDEDLAARHSAFIDRYVGEVPLEARKLIDLDRVIS